MTRKKSGPPRAQRIALGALLAIYVLPVLCRAYGLIDGAPALETESAWRIAAGGLLVFLLPGLAWGERLGFVSDHILTTVSLSFALTLGIAVALLPLPFIFSGGIGTYGWLLMAVSLAGICLSAVKIRRRGRSEFLAPLFELFTVSPLQDPGPRLSLLVVCALSFVAFRWGEDIFDVVGEKLLHADFVRKYYALPMRLSDFGVVQGYPPSNFIHLWEYLVATWAYCVNVDPLPIVFRARFLIPLLGLSSMYLLVRAVMEERRKSEAVFGGVLLLVLGRVTLAAPSLLARNSNDVLRGHTLFMGTFHHSDGAMDVLVPLGFAALLLAIRERTGRSAALLAGVAAATFFWHPREYFEAMVYAGIFGITLLALWRGGRAREAWKALRPWAVPFAAMAGVGLGLLLTSHFLLPKAKGSLSLDEFGIKKYAFDFAFSSQSWMKIRNMFNFPSDFLLPTIWRDRNIVEWRLSSDWNFFPWLILSALAALGLQLRGDAQDRKFSLFYVLLWFLVFSWNFSFLMTLTLTYSEFYMTTPRILYVFADVVIASGLVLAARLLAARFKRRGVIAALLGMAALGLGFRLWWKAGFPGAEPLSDIFTPVFFLVPVYFRLRKPRKDPARKAPDYLLALAGAAALLAVAFGEEYAETAKRAFSQSRPPLDWFGGGNPLGFSRELIGFIRALPPRQRILVDQTGNSVVSIYAPQYMAIYPYVIQSMGETNEILDAYAGRHVLYKSHFQNYDVNDAAALQYLKEREVNYLVVREQHYAALVKYFNQNGKNFRILFDNPGRRELVASFEKDR